VNSNQSSSKIIPYLCANRPLEILIILIILLPNGHAVTEKATRLPRIANRNKYILMHAGWNNFGDTEMIQLSS
jgi:hypothetical protein